MALKLITPPALEPITLSEAKTHLKIDFSDDDSYITALITAARHYCEKFQNRAYITQTWEAAMDRFPNSPFKLPMPLLQSVTSIKYYGTDDTEYTFASSNYFVDTHSQPGRVSLNYLVSWPTTTLRPINGVIIRFVAGHGDNASDVPSEVIHAIKMLVAEWYERRISVGDDMPISQRVHSAVSALLWFERVVPV